MVWEENGYTEETRKSSFQAQRRERHKQPWTVDGAKPGRNQEKEIHQRRSHDYQLLRSISVSESSDGNLKKGLMGKVQLGS